jgi:integrase
VHKVHRVFSLLLKRPVKDGRLGRNPAEEINLPRVETSERRYLTHDQVRALAEECSVHRLVVLFLAYTGLRFGEMAALWVGRLDLMRRRAVVAESVTLVRGVQTQSSVPPLNGSTSRACIPMSCAIPPASRSPPGPPSRSSS